MLQAISLEEALQRWQFVPQAIISKPITFFADHAGANVVSGHDELDEYDGLAFALSGVPFLAMHHRGHPPDTTTIYLQREVSAIEDITALVASIIARFDVPQSALKWQRKDNPDF